MALLCLAPTVAFAQLSSYSQDFEGLDQTNPDALNQDGWLIFANVFNADGSYAYGYGVFPAPNGGNGFSAIIPGPGDPNVGGPDQGEQQLSIYSDYNNADHGIGRVIEANVFQEQVVGAADVGTRWTFSFDATRGNIEGATTARAWFKTLDPNAGFALTNFIWVDMTDVPTTWDRYSVSIDIDAGLVGQILQFGFLNNATNYEGSAVYYDNIEFARAVSVDIKPGACPNPVNRWTKGVLPVAVLGTDDLDVYDLDPASLNLNGGHAVRWSYEDVATPFGGDLCGCTEQEGDGYMDLVLYIPVPNIVDAMGYPQCGDQQMSLGGSLVDGTLVRGADCIEWRGGCKQAPGGPKLEATVGGSTSGSGTSLSLK
ncbi:hypothetical protein ABI59_19235 [Acidobacteria bacterium Mor1]|nr:hypothetical protein ABI59_19235 [Acidobacteria bacterium Mor1]